MRDFSGPSPLQEGDLKAGVWDVRVHVFQDHPVHDQAIKWSHLLGHSLFLQVLFKFPTPAMADSYRCQSKSHSLHGPTAGQSEVSTPLCLGLSALSADNTGSARPTISPMCCHGTHHQSKASCVESLQVMFKPFSLRCHKKPFVLWTLDQ